MAVSLVLNGLGLAIAAATSPVAASHTVVAAGTPRMEAARPHPRARTRDERIGAIALRGFPVAEPMIAQTKTWSMPGGSEVEIGALGGSRSGKADVAHVALALQF